MLDSALPLNERKTRCENPLEDRHGPNALRAPVSWFVPKSRRVSRDKFPNVAGIGPATNEGQGIQKGCVEQQYHDQVFV